MRLRSIALWGLIAFSARADFKVVRGVVTYLAGGNVYTSLGRTAGVQDSLLLYVVRGSDTTAVLKVFAVSSKSSVCRIVRSSRPVSSGDQVSGIVQIVQRAETPPDSNLHRPVVLAALPSTPKPARREQMNEGCFNLQGRVGAQYFTSLYNTRAYNIAQPGVLLNLRGEFHDVPLRMEVYANLRSLTTGNQSPFGRHAINQSRIYGLSVTYENDATAFSVGRIISPYAPALGYIDGLSASAKVGILTFGTAMGYQPDFALRGVSSDYRKIALYAQVASGEQQRFALSTAYARTYYHSLLDREVANIMVSSALSGNLFLFGNVETDLRVKRNREFILLPRVTNAYINLSCRLINAVSVGLGFNASRPYYSFQAIRDIPDSLLVDDLRSGVSMSLMWLLPGGISFSNTYTPRSARDAAFGKEYSNTSALGFTDILSSGISLRSNVNLHSNVYTQATGYGVAVQRTFGQLFDLTVRHQRSTYTIRQTDQRERSTTIGADLLVFLSSSLTFMTTYDWLEGYGSRSHSIFAELGVRF